MATPLMWKSYQILDATYGQLLYPHPFYCHIAIEKFVPSFRRARKFIPFYIGSFLCLLICIFSILLTLKSFANPGLYPTYFPFFYLTLSAIAGIDALLNWAFVKIVYKSTNSYLNHLLRFDRKVRCDTQNKGYCRNDSIYTVCCNHFVAVYKNSEKLDTMGITMISISASFFITGCLFGNSLILLDIDPTYYVIKSTYPVFADTKLAWIIRYLIINWYSLESSRSSVVAFLPSIFIFNLTKNCLEMITEQSKTCKLSAVKLYAQLQCISQIGREMVTYVAAIMMCFGFVVCVMGLWIIIKGRSIFPLNFYLIICVVIMISYVVVFQTLPVIIVCYESSKKLVYDRWQKQGVLDYLGKGDYERKYWRKVIRSRRPLVFYFGTAMFEKGTQVNFFMHIVDFTATLVLISV